MPTKTKPTPKPTSTKKATPSESDADRRDREVRDAMDAKVTAALKAAGHADEHVIYSAYRTDADDVPIDNLDKVAIKGKAIVVLHKNEFYGGSDSDNFSSPVLLNPTWLQLCVYANAAIEMTNDNHHVFLEGVTRVTKARKKQDEAGIKVYELAFGS